MSRSRPPVEPGKRFDLGSFFSPRPSEKTKADLEEKTVTNPKEALPEAPEKKEATAENLVFLSRAFSVSQKSENQDAYIQNPETGFFAVFDGHHKKGGEFSKELVTIANQLLTKNKTSLEDPESRQQAIKTFFRDFYKEGQGKVPYKKQFLSLGGRVEEGNAAAAVAFVSPDGSINVASVGNCEVSRYSAKTGKFEVLTIGTNKISQSGRSYTGSFSDSEMITKFYSKLFEPGDAILVISDGAVPLLKSSETKDIFKNQGFSLEQKISQLNSLASRFSKQDDVTVVVAEVKK